MSRSEPKNKNSLIHIVIDTSSTNNVLYCHCIGEKKSIELMRTKALDLFTTHFKESTMCIKSNVDGKCEIRENYMESLADFDPTYEETWNSFVDIIKYNVTCKESALYGLIFKESNKEIMLFDIRRTIDNEGFFIDVPIKNIIHLTCEKINIID